VHELRNSLLLKDKEIWERAVPASVNLKFLITERFIRMIRMKKLKCPNCGEMVTEDYEVCGTAGIPKYRSSCQP
jgi:hypothetical protein